ncbi:MAG: hypothetical protein WCE82_01520 [Halobacteriota archaeon]
MVIVLKKDEVPFQRKQRRFFIRFSKNDKICGKTDFLPIDLNRISRENCPRPKTFDMVGSGVAIAEAETFGRLVFRAAFAISALVVGSKKAYAEIDDRASEFFVLPQDHGCNVL